RAWRVANGRAVAGRHGVPNERTVRGSDASCWLRDSPASRPGSETRRCNGAARWFDSPQAQNQRVEQSLERFADTVAVVSLHESNMPPERTLQADALEELLDQSHSAELSQANSIGSNAKISGSA